MAAMTNLTKSHYDAIIIGAGSVGAPTAYSFAKSGLKTLVIDKASSVGQESNKKAIGGIRATHSDPAKIKLSLRSIDIFSTWQTIHGDDLEWEKGGYCFVAYRDREREAFQNLLVKQKNFGLNIDWHDKKELLELVPHLNPAGLLGGTFSPDDGSASPLLSANALYKHATQLGAGFHFNETVNDIVTKSGKVIGVKTDRGEYGADVVINAAGPWSREISQMVGFDIPVTPDSHEAAITEPVAKFLNPMVVDIRPAPGSANYYFYQHRTGQIIFCITPKPNIWGFDCDETSTFLPMVAQRMVELMPILANIRVRRTWRGLYPMTPDGFPIVGKLNEVEGFIQAAGMCGQGFMLGPGLGELLTRIVLDQLEDDDETVLSYLTPYREFEGQELLK
jgi:sarcosine oxidase subunit beta